jgi:hypothetical protein
MEVLVEGLCCIRPCTKSIMCGCNYLFHTQNMAVAQCMEMAKDCPDLNHGCTAY